MKKQKKTCRATDKSSSNLNKLLFNYSIRNEFKQILESIEQLKVITGGSL